MKSISIHLTLLYYIFQNIVSVNVDQYKEANRTFYFKEMKKCNLKKIVKLS